MQLLETNQFFANILTETVLAPPFLFIVAVVWTAAIVGLNQHQK